MDPDAQAGVGSATGMQLLNMDLSRRAAAGVQQQEDEAAAAAQVRGRRRGVLVARCRLGETWQL